MRIGIVAKHGLREASEMLVALERWFDGRAEVVWAPEAAELLPSGDRVIVTRDEMATAVDLILVLGGDGTLLAMADRIGQNGRDIPLLGVNFGSLGFLTEIRREELNETLSAVLSGRVELDERMMLRADTRRGDVVRESRVILNDVVFTRNALSRMLDLDVTVGDQFVTSVKADGLIVASPTGSTAYNLSAGGPIVHPAMDAVVLTPIAPHMLTNRPIVIPAAREVRVRSSKGNNAEVYVTFDGQYGFPLASNEEVSITRAKRPLRLVRAAARSYFEVLREKLKWGER